MTLDVFNDQNKKTGSVELSDAVFGGRVNTALIWEAVVHQNAVDRRGTHATKTRGLVRGTGSKPWRQKGTGRARAGEVRSPLWRSGGTVFGPQPRSYAFHLSRKSVRRALRAAFTQKLGEGIVTVIEELSVDEPTTKVGADFLTRLGIVGRVVFVDIAPNENCRRALRNLPLVKLVNVNQLTTRDIMGSRQLVITKAALERFVQVLTS